MISSKQIFPTSGNESEISLLIIESTDITTDYYRKTLYVLVLYIIITCQFRTSYLLYVCSVCRINIMSLSTAY